MAGDVGYEDTDAETMSARCWEAGAMRANIWLSALDMALEDRKNMDMRISNLMHHSDQGVQYAS